MHFRLPLICFFGMACCNGSLMSLAAGEDWPQFRGPTGQGIATATNLPLEWSEEKNIAWKTPIPGRGWSSPVVLGNQIWMTTATDEGHSLRAVCVDVANPGRVLHDVEGFRVDQSGARERQEQPRLADSLHRAGAIVRAFRHDGHGLPRDRHRKNSLDQRRSEARPLSGAGQLAGALSQHVDLRA